MNPKLLMIGDSIKAFVGAIVTVSLTAKPVSIHDPLEMAGKILWILASVLAISWWITRFRDRKKKK